jgi:hypothetical protein
MVKPPHQQATITKTSMNNFAPFDVGLREQEKLGGTLITRDTVASSRLAIRQRFILVRRPENFDAFDAIPVPQQSQP